MFGVTCLWCPLAVLCLFSFSRIFSLPRCDSLLEWSVVTSEHRKSCLSAQSTQPLPFRTGRAATRWVEPLTGQSLSTTRTKDHAFVAFVFPFPSLGFYGAVVFHSIFPLHVHSLSFSLPRTNTSLVHFLKRETLLLASPLWLVSRNHAIEMECWGRLCI